MKHKSVKKFREMLTNFLKTGFFKPPQTRNSEKLVEYIERSIAEAKDMGNSFCYIYSATIPKEVISKFPKCQFTNPRCGTFLLLW